MASSATLRDIAAATARGDRHLGDMVFWNLSDASVDRATFEKRWSDAGMHPAMLPEMPTAEKTLRVAVDEAKLGQQSILIRRSLENDVEIVIAVVKETRHESGEPSYDVEATVRLDRALGTLSSARLDHPTIKIIVDAFSRMRDTHTSNDVRKTLIRTIESFAAIPLRETGGVYWVPATKAEELRRLQECIEQFGTSKLYLVPVHNGQDANRSLGDAATKSLESELTELQKEMVGFINEPPRPDTLARRFTTFEALRSRAELYRTLLSVKVTDLNDALDKLAEQARKLLAGDTSELPADD